ncbi:MAG: putative 3-carboxymuconate cyclase, partial [Rubrobacteraceae bacterium]|nr:putative 3-carboxymuconate cyclase [Rubrobacteraceae bacterium]
MQTDPHERGSSMQQSPTNDTASAGAVYVQTNAAPNEVIAFRRADDGSLDRIGSVATGGDADGTPHLQSQGSVTLDDLSVFSVAADGSIELRERVHTGATPRSVAERDGLVVVLNTGEPGLAPFRLQAEGIERVEGGDQALDPSHADPAQVAFSPDGTLVLITERATDSIVTY